MRDGTVRKSALGFVLTRVRNGRRKSRRRNGTGRHASFLVRVGRRLASRSPPCTRGYGTLFQMAQQTACPGALPVPPQDRRGCTRRVSRTTAGLRARSRPEAGKLCDHRALDVLLPDRRLKLREVLPRGRRLFLFIPTPALSTNCCCVSWWLF